MQRNTPTPAPLEYAEAEANPPLPPAPVAVLLCVPMVLAVYFFLPPPLRPLTPAFLFHRFWIPRAFAMLCALVSIFLFADKRVRRLPWHGKLNLLVNIPGLAICTFSIFRYVWVNLPPPN